MRYVKQLLIILGFSFAGEALKFLLPFPIPASIYGMVLLLIGLLTGLVPLPSVKETGTFLIEIMPVMFIPAAAGLLTAWGDLKPIVLPVAVITVVTTVLVMAMTGRVTQAMIRREKRRRK